MDHILLVEDEQSLARGLQFNLEAEGYKVTHAADGQQAMDLLQKNTYDLLILDIMLPYHDGFEIARFVRGQSRQIPILILTARQGIEDRLKGLRLGADDYLTKPFSLDELLLRVKRILERKAWYRESELQTTRLGNVEIDFGRLKLIRPSGEEINLTALEAKALKYLLEHRGKAVSRQELLQKVWDMDPEVETRTVDIFIARLRKYVEANPAQPEWIQSVRGVGYLIPKENKKG